MSYYEASLLPDTFCRPLGALSFYWPALLPCSAGLKLEPDTFPYTSGTMDSDADIIDGSLFAAATDNFWASSYSYGVDLGRECVVAAMIIHCYPGAVTPTSWYTVAHDSVVVFKSADGSAWTQVEQFDAPMIIHAGLGQLSFYLPFTRLQAAKYFKVVYVDFTTLAVNPGGASCSIGEIQVYGARHNTRLAFQANSSLLKMAGSVRDFDLSALSMAFPANSSVAGIAFKKFRNIRLRGA